MRLDDLRVGLPRSKSQPLPPLVGGPPPRAGWGARKGSPPAAGGGVLPRARPHPPPPLVRHERLRKPGEGSPLPSEEAGRARLGGGRHASEGRDDALAVDLE